MALQYEPTQDQTFVGMNLSRFKETCASATHDAQYISTNELADKKQYSRSYDEADEMTEQIAINLMKETWNIPLDE